MTEKNNRCAKFEQAVSIISQRWNGLLLFVLLDGEKRFSEIKAAIPELSDKVLADKLKFLERSTLIERHVSKTTPVKVTYTLTPKGLDFQHVINAIHEWSLKW